MINDKEWEQFVPRSVARLVNEWDITTRLKELSRQNK